MLISCTFKKVYTCNTFSQYIDFNLSPKQIKECISNNVLLKMNLLDFNIIVAGTMQCEQNNPIDCTLDNVSLYSIIGNKSIFYIEKVDLVEIMDIDDANLNTNDDLDFDANLNTNMDDLNTGMDDLNTDNTNNTNLNSHEMLNIIENYNFECPICYSYFTHAECVILGCNHKICRNCISSWYRTGTVLCPYCRI